MEQRLQKVIAASGYCSRREAERLIEAGRVAVDGRVATLGDRCDPDTAELTIDGHALSHRQAHYYLVMNKPVGVVTTSRDPKGRRTVLDLLKDIPVRVFPVGRLDYNTSGLLILTNDGDLANRLAHPRFEIDKTYLVRIRGTLRRDDRLKLERGILLEDGQTAPALVRNVRSKGSHSWFELTIHEGRNRQVRRMCESLGYDVSRLTRVGYAELRLDDLAPGQSRMLSTAEVQALKRAVGLEKRSKRGA